MKTTSRSHHQQCRRQTPFKWTSEPQKPCQLCQQIPEILPFDFQSPRRCNVCRKYYSWMMKTRTWLRDGDGGRSSQNKTIQLDTWNVTSYELASPSWRYVRPYPVIQWHFTPEKLSIFRITDASRRMHIRPSITSVVCNSNNDKKKVVIKIQVSPFFEQVNPITAQGDIMLKWKKSFPNIVTKWTTRLLIAAVYKVLLPKTLHFCFIVSTTPPQNNMAP